MKELSIEQKARRYDKAIGRVKKLKENPKAIFFEERNIPIYDYIFPELAESEDERIRNLIYLSIEKGMGIPNDKDRKKALAWLEKQGEQNLANSAKTCKVETKFKVGQTIKKEGFNLGFNIVKIEDGFYYNDMGDYFPFTDQDNWELVEQKPADNEMKEILRTEYEKGRADAIAEMQNTAWSEEDENRINRLIAYFEDKESFTAEDDVVYANWLKSIKDRVQPQPKQEWKQENTGDLTDFENAMMHIGGSFFGQHAGLDPNDTNAIKEQANLLLELVPSKEWSEEDENRFNNLCWLIDNSDENEPTKNGFKNWLKSLKERYTWKPSEEQMKVLVWCKPLFADPKSKGILESLINDLKKLREDKL